MREAPALVLIEKLLAAGVKVKAYDPVAMEEAKHRIGDVVEYCKDQYEALIDADALLIVTEWPEFKFPNLNVIKKLLKNNLIFDGRNIYDPKEINDAGFDYYCIGIEHK
jgi:UDPglucose 6-dehydrogenase